MNVLDEWKISGVNIKTLFTSLEQQNMTIAAFGKAELICGHDTASDNLFLVYGRDLLNAIIADEKAKKVNIMVVDLIQATDELEILLAAVQVAKGNHEYLSYEDQKQINELERLYEKGD